MALLDEFASRFFDELDYVKECANGIAIRDQMQHIKQVRYDGTYLIRPLFYGPGFAPDSETLKPLPPSPAKLRRVTGAALLSLGCTSVRHCTMLCAVSTERQRARERELHAQEAGRHLATKQQRKGKGNLRLPPNKPARFSRLPACLASSREHLPFRLHLHSARGILLPHHSWSLSFVVSSMLGGRSPLLRCCTEIVPHGTEPNRTDSNR